MESGKLHEYRKHRLYKYLVSALVVAFATFIQHLLWPIVEPAPYLFFYPAVIFASVYGDGNFAILLSMICAQYFFTKPYFSFDFAWPGDIIRQLVFLFSAFTLRLLVKKEIEAKLIAQDTLDHLRAEKVIREKFVSTLTHDLQTPLTAAKMSVQLLIKNPEPQSIDKNGERILFNLTRIEHMIRDLLDTNKIRAGKKLPLSISEMDICLCIHETIAGLSSVHGNRFVVKAPEKIMGFWGEDAIRRILENLCSNAVKYGLDGTPVSVFIEESDSCIYLKVHNLGDTIPPHELELMFQPFERSKFHSKKGQKGWGLGLTLVKGLTEAQGGNVSVTSDHTGTTFIVSLPKDARQFVSEN